MGLYKKNKKRRLWSFGVHDPPDLSPGMIKNSQNPSYMTTRVRHFHVKLGIALSSVAKEDTCRVRPSVGFGGFSLEQRSLCRNRMTSQLFELFKCKIVSFSSKAKPPSFSARLKSAILHLQSPKNVHYYFIYGRLTFKQPPNFNK